MILTSSDIRNLIESGIISDSSDSSDSTNSDSNNSISTIEKAMDASMDASMNSRIKRIDFMKRKIYEREQEQQEKREHRELEHRESHTPRMSDPNPDPNPNPNPVQALLSQVNPASFDITLSPNILVEINENRNDPVTFNSVDLSSSTSHYSLSPGEFILASTNEIFHLPPFISAVFNLKSTVARQGLSHSLAGFIDPGFHGSITLELHNITRFSTIELTPNQRIGQVIFHQHQPTDSPYSGKYQNQSGTTTAGTTTAAQTTAQPTTL